MTWPATRGGLWQTPPVVGFGKTGQNRPLIPVALGAGDLAGCPGGRAPQVLVNLRYGHRSFPDGGGDPFDRPGAYVAGGEHSWHAGFQRQRYRLARSGPVLTGQVAAGQDESVLVARDIVG